MAKVNNWQKYDIGHKYTDAEIATLQKRLQKTYRRATLDAEKKLKAHLVAYRRKDDDMRKLVAAGKLKVKDYNDWRKNQMLTGKRWENIRNRMAVDMNNVNKIARGIVNESVPTVWGENANWALYVGEKQLGMETTFVIYNKDTVRKLASENPNLLPKAVIDDAKDIAWNERKLASEMTQGILLGEDIPTIAGRVQRVTGANEVASMRAARTLMTRAQNMGRMETYKRFDDAGIKTYKVWCATVDERTRSSHRDIDGERVPVNEPFPNDLMFPADPNGSADEVMNCRCTMTTEFEGFHSDMTDPEERDFSYLDETGEDYETWKKGGR